MQTLFDKNQNYRNRANLSRPDALIMDLIERAEGIGLEPEVSMIFSDTPDKERKRYETSVKKFYSTIDGAVGLGIDEEIRIDSLDFAEDTQIVRVSKYGNAMRITEEQIMYWDDEFAPKYEVWFKEAMEDIWYKLNQKFADVLLRGWETSYKDIFGDTVTMRDMEGSNALFAPNHKIIAGGTNAFRQSNVVVKRIVGGYQINPVFDTQAILDTVEYATKVRGYKGRQIRRNLDTLLVDSKYLPTLNQAFASITEVNTANGGANIFRLMLGGKLEVKTWNRLIQDGEGNVTNPVSTKGYDEYYFLYDSARIKEQMHYTFHQLPILQKLPQTGTAGGEVHYLKAILKIWFTGYDYIFGSNATAGTMPVDFPVK